MCVVCPTESLRQDEEKSAFVVAVLFRLQIGIGIATYACAHTQTTRDVLHLVPLRVAFGRIGEAIDHPQIFSIAILCMSPLDTGQLLL